MKTLTYDRLIEQRRKRGLILSERWLCALQAIGTTSPDAPKGAVPPYVRIFNRHANAKAAVKIDRLSPLASRLFELLRMVKLKKRMIRKNI